MMHIKNKIIILLVTLITILSACNFCKNEESKISDDKNLEIVEFDEQREKVKIQLSQFLKVNENSKFIVHLNPENRSIYDVDDKKYIDAINLIITNERYMPEEVLKGSFATIEVKNNGVIVSKVIIHSAILCSIDQYYYSISGGLELSNLVLNEKLKLDN